MDRNVRKVAVEGLTSYATHSYGMQHQLYRVLKVHTDGLSDKELAYLQKRYDELVEWNQKMSRLNDRLRHK